MSLSIRERMGMKEREGESASYPNHGFFLFLFFLIYYSRERISPRECVLSEVSCVHYQSGCFSVIDDCYINYDMFSNRIREDFSDRML